MLDKSDKEFIRNEITEAVETAVGQIISATAKGFEEVDKRFDRLDKDVATLKEDVSTLKEDVSTLKGDMRDVKRRLTDLETDAPRKLEQTVFTA